MKVTLEGRVHNWSLFGATRAFGLVCLPYGEAREVFRVFRFNGLTGKGEQRETVASHVRKIEKEIRDSKFTPTPISVGLRKTHLVDLKLTKEGMFLLPVEDKQAALPMTDGQHRFEGIEAILEDLRQRHKQEKDEARKQILDTQINEVLALPIAATIHFDGDPQIDFINLQAGRSVDAAHMLTLKIRRQALTEPAMALAFEVARELSTNEESPYHNQIRFDSRGISPLPISTMCARGSSDLSTSLVGLAKVGHDQKPEWLAHVVIEVFKAFKEHCSELLEYGKVLTPIANAGTKGSATVLIGVAISVAFDALSREDKSLDLTRVIETASNHLNVQVEKSFAGGMKRALMHEFGQPFFSSCDAEDLHHGIPVKLIQLLSASCYGIPPLPKEDKPPKPAKTASPVTAEKRTPKKGAAPEPKTTPKADAKTGPDKKKKTEMPKNDETKQKQPAMESSRPKPVETGGTEPWDKVLQG